MSGEISDLAMCDNIGDDDFDADVQLAQFIEEVASSSEESIADFYIKQMQESESMRTNYYKHPSTVISDVSDSLKMIGGNSYKNREYYNNTPKISSYINYIDDEFNEVPDNSSPINYDSTNIDIQNSLDTISDRADVIYDCVKSSDQIINEMYEKQILLEDAVDRLNIDIISMKNHIIELEKLNKQLLDENHSIHNKFDGVAALLRKLLEDTRAIRYKDEEE